MAAQVGLELSAKNFQSGTLADTVGSNETKHLAGSRHRQAMELEAVGAIAVCDLALEVGGQVDDSNGVEGALLGADTATDTQRLGDEGQARLGSDLDTELATADHRARLLTLLTTLARATLFGEARGQQASPIGSGVVGGVRGNWARLLFVDEANLLCQC